MDEKQVRHQEKNKNKDQIWVQWIDAVAAPVFVLNDGKVVYANRPALDLSGYTLSEALRKDFKKFFVHASSADCLERLGAPGISSLDCEARLRTAQGDLLPVKLSFRQVGPEFFAKDGQAIGQMVTLTDLSDHQQRDHLDEALEQKSADLEAVRQTLSEMVSVVNEQGEPLLASNALDDLLNTWRDVQEHDRLQAEVVLQSDLLRKIFEVDPGGLAVIVGPELVFQLANPAYRAITPNPDLDPIGHAYEEIWPEFSERGREMLERVMQTGQPVHLDRYESNQPGQPARYFSFRLHPLNWDNQPAVLVVIWEKTELEHAQRKAVSLVHEAQRTSSELNAIINALPEAVLILDADGRILQANPASQAMFGFDPIAMDRQELLGRLEIRHLDGARMQLEDMPFTLALRGRTVRNQRLLLVGEDGQEVDVMASSSPLFADRQLVGAVSIWSDVTELFQRRHELEALVKVASALRSTIIQEEMFPVILDQIMGLLKVEGVSLLMPDPATHEVVVRWATGAWESTIGQRLPAGKGVSSQVIADGHPYLNNHIQQDEHLVTTVFTGNLRCGACVPLSSHGMTIGAVWVGRNSPLTDEDVQLLTAISNIAASNLYRARLFEQTQLRFQRISALHSIDMAITSSLDLQLTLSVLLDQVVSQMQVDAADILLFDTALHWLEFASGRGFVQPSARYQPQRLGESPAGQVALERRTISISDLSKANMPKDWLSPEEGFQSYFAAPLIAKGQVKGVLELFNREPRYPDSELLEFLETLATQAAIALDSAELFERLQRSNEELSLAYDATIEGWSHALELRDQETHGHAQRVTELTIRLARRIGVRDEEIPHYRRGVLLHDIGKMAIPDSILLKDGPLTPDEQEVMRRHPVYAYDLLHPIAYLRPALDIPYAHHEWWDGSGYPRGLKSEEIPLAARIFAVVDVWDALRSDRSYRPAWPVHKVIEHIRSLSGTHFDPKVVEEFIKMMQSIEPLTRYKSSRI